MAGGAWPATGAQLPIRAAGRRAIGLLFVVLSAWAGAVAGMAQTGGDDARRVLLLYSSDQTLPATNIVGAAVLRGLGASTDPRVEVRSEFLDMSRFRYPAYRDDLAAFLAKKHAGTGIDLVVALGPPALDFIASYRDRVAPGARIAFGLVSEPELAESRLPEGEVSGIVSDYDVTKTLELGLSLQPAARRIAVVSGTLPYDKRLEAKARQAIAALGAEYTVTYITDLPYDAVLDQVASLPKDTIVLVLSFFRDATGRRFVPRDAGGEIARAASAPSYGPYDVFIGLGVVGGYTDTFESTGAALARLALDILAGKAGTGGDIRNPEHAFRVDARVMERRGLSEANLPPGTVVLFAEKTVWEQYWHVIAAAIGVIALQSILLAALFIQLVRRRRAEAARKAAEADAEAQRREVAHMSRVLILGELSGAIAHELNQPLTAILANAQAAQMMLAREAPDIDEALLALEDIVEDDNRAGQVIQRLRGMLKKDRGPRELVDVNEIVRSTYNLVRSEVVARRIEAGLQLGDGLDRVPGDAVQLQQVVLNLVVNAMDALAGQPGERRLAVKTEAGEAGGVVLSVSDNGAGIAPSDAGRLFEPFFTTKPKGLGLGLSICSTILAAHGGGLTLARGEGGGAVATVTLPSGELRAAAE